jgi:hypothetical protein
MLTLYEFTIFGIHLTILLAWLIIIQILNPGKAMREAMEIRYEETKEKFVQSEFEEPESDEDVPFDPAQETFTMTENPMLRNRKVEMSEMEMVD